MRRRTIVALAALAIGLPAAGFAQESQPQQRSQRGLMQNSVEWLLTQQEQFKPSAEQVTKLQAIARKLADATATQRMEMQKIRSENADGDRAAMREKMQPLMQQLRKQDDAALQEALAVLNDEQKKVVTDLFEQRRQQMQSRRRGAGAR